MRALEASFNGRIGAVAIDTGTGSTITHRPGERFPLVSTFKAFAAAAVLRKARRRDPGLLDRVIPLRRIADSAEACFTPVTEKHVTAA